MDRYVTGSMIRKVREEKHLTQEELAARLYVSSKAVSKWETGQGFPDISLLEPLAKALGVSVIELLAGQNIINQNRSSNMLHAVGYICPVCGNGILSLGQAVVSCCGITLPPMEPEDADEDHQINIAVSDGEYAVTIDHPMQKDHYITCIAALADNSSQFAKLYPESSAEARFRIDGVRWIYAYCNRHGLFRVSTKGVVR